MRLILAAALACACAFAQPKMPGFTPQSASDVIQWATAKMQPPQLEWGDLPTASDSDYQWFLITDANAGCDGGGSSGTPCVVWSDGTNWVQVAGGASSGGQVDTVAVEGFTCSGTTDVDCAEDGSVFPTLGGDNTYTGRTTHTPSTAQTIGSAGTAILANSTQVQVSCSSALTLTAAPTIADGSNGAVVTIINTGSNNCIVQDQDTLASSNLQLSASSVTIAPKQSLTLRYNSAIGDWVQEVGGGTTTASYTTTGSGAPSSGDCDAADEVGRSYMRNFGTPTWVNVRYECKQTGSSAYSWVRQDRIRLASGSTTTIATDTTSTSNVVATVPIPGGLLAVGDAIEVTGAVVHGGTLATSCRFGYNIGNATSGTVSGIGTEALWTIQSIAAVTGASEIYRQPLNVTRVSAGTLAAAGTTPSASTSPISGDIDLTMIMYWGATAGGDETCLFRNYTVEVITAR